MIDLYQYRSYAKCVSEGYRFLADNVWLVTKVMWPYFLTVSTLATLSNAVNTHANVAIIAGQQIYMEEVIASFSLMALVAIAYIVTLRRLYVMFKRMADITGKTHIYIKKVCRAFFHHFGKIVGTTLLSLFLLMVMSIIVFLPFVVAMQTYFGSVEAQVNFGDTTLIPVSGYVLMFVCGIVTYYIINMFSVAFYATLTFLYGSIKATK